MYENAVTVTWFIDLTGQLVFPGNCSLLFVYENYPVFLQVK